MTRHLATDVTNLSTKMYVDSCLQLGVGVSSTKQLFAHSRNASGHRHLLVDHLHSSAALARRFGEVFGAGDLAAYLALVHDVGKGCCAWQERLNWAEPRRDRVGLPHKEAGTLLARRAGGLAFAAAVHGHHGGLPNQQKVKAVLAMLAGNGRDAEMAREATATVAKLIPEIEQRPAVPDWLGTLRSGETDELTLEMLVRMVFSCLVDADFLDTGAHFAGVLPRVAEPVGMAGLASRFEARRVEYLAQRPPSPVDEIRGGVFDESLAAAADEPGMYVLHVPTGGAKTMAAGGFALRHAAAHGLSRVVFAVPFISITQQNAQVFRDLLDPGPDEGADPVVLEHHSSVQLDDDRDDAQQGPEEAWRRLAAENWDAPFVVTTTVQLFQSLFANRPATMRKLHRLAGSVIVLDEVQALPARLLLPILSGLRTLVEHFGASVVLASATQPEFWNLRALEGMPRKTMVSNVPEPFTKLERVRYEWRQGPEVSWASMADEIAGAGAPATLTIVNTTKNAAHLHALLAEEFARRQEANATPGVEAEESSSGSGGVVLHLSTRMTAEHRHATINTIKDCLAENLPVHVVSTSLIEAGVDVSFPLVFRAWAPAESLQQAAGRCNRDGHARGTVVIFRPEDGGLPKDNAYKAALEATAVVFGPEKEPRPDNVDALQRYYAERDARLGSNSAPFGEKIQTLRRKLDFPEVADKFQMIENDHTQPVVVLRPGILEEKRAAVERDIRLLSSGHPRGPEPLRRLQPYTAALPRNEVAEAVQAGLADPVIGDMVFWRGHYHEYRGLDPSQVEDHDDYNL